MHSSSGVCIHLAHSSGPPKIKKFLPQKYLILTQIFFFSILKRFSMPAWKNQSPSTLIWHTPKISFIYPKEQTNKNSQTPIFYLKKEITYNYLKKVAKENISYNYQKKEQFSKQKKSFKNIFLGIRFYDEYT